GMDSRRQERELQRDSTVRDREARFGPLVDGEISHEPIDLLPVGTTPPAALEDLVHEATLRVARDRPGRESRSLGGFRAPVDRQLRHRYALQIPNPRERRDVIIPSEAKNLPSMW